MFVRWLPKEMYCCMKSKLVMACFEMLLLWCQRAKWGPSDAKALCLLNPDELCWAHTDLPRCTHTIQILQSLTPPRSPPLYPSSHHQIVKTIPSQDGAQERKLNRIRLMVSSLTPQITCLQQCCLLPNYFGGPWFLLPTYTHTQT